ncbi:MAG: alpha/beta fold hydrolase [Burkholderiales bacterium]|nr:alpha/beta fold hydrolase [Burkholderiales bacterium]
MNGTRRAIALLALAVFAMRVSADGVEPGRTHEQVATGSNEVEVIAEGRGPLLVLLASAARSAGDFDEVAPLLAAQGFRVLRPEPRGSGGTTGPHEGITLHDAARDVAAVIRHENAGPAIVVGHAAGSFVARMLAVDAPELVRGVVLAAAGARRYPPSVGATLLELARPDLDDEARLRLLHQAYFAAGSDAHAWLRGWRPLISYGSVPGRAPSEADRAVWWGAGDKPVLEIQGLEDPFKPRAAAGEYKAEFGDRVTIVEIAGASHALFPEQPQRVVDAIVRWVRGLPPLPRRP